MLPLSLYPISPFGVLYTAELGTPQFFNFATRTTRQCKRASVARKNTKNVKLQCLNGVAMRTKCNM